MKCTYRKLETIILEIWKNLVTLYSNQLSRTISCRLIVVLTSLNAYLIEKKPKFTAFALKKKIQILIWYIDSVPEYLLSKKIDKKTPIGNV